MSFEEKHKIKLLVHLHIYYYNQVDYFISKLKNITNCEWDLYITISKRNEKELQKFKQLKPNVQIIEVNNIGYDIYPFLYLLKNISLENYDYVLKLHTKRFFTNKILVATDVETKNFEWRNSLVNALIKNKKTFLKNIKQLSQENYGLICCKKYLLDIKNSIPQDIENIEKLKNQLVISSNYQSFLAGTMFIVRADILQRLKNIDFSEKDFEKGNSGEGGTIAHAIERIFCILAVDCGYNILALKWKNLFEQNLLKMIFSIKNDHKYKVITIFDAKIKFKSKKLLKKLNLKENSFVEDIFSIKNSDDYTYKTHKVVTIFGKKIKILLDKYFDAIKDDKLNYIPDKKVCIFASYNSLGIIDNNLIKYLKEIRKFYNYIIFIADNPICQKELLKIENLVEAYECRRHNEYDFGSYKRGFEILQKNCLMDEIDNILFCNDSVKFVGKSLKEVFENSKNKDFYGITQHSYGYKKVQGAAEYDWVKCQHIQSYFFIISKKIFNTDFFKSFMSDIKHENSKEDIIEKYEQGLSTLIVTNGFQISTYYPTNNSNIDLCDIYLKYSYKNQIFKKKKYYSDRKNIFLQTIFSIKNEYAENGTKIKIMTILGIGIKLKRKQKK